MGNAPFGGIGCGGNSSAWILVLFILLVIITCTFIC